MRDWKHCLIFFLCLLAVGATQAQKEAEEETAPPVALDEGTQFGIRFSYQLQFPSKNAVNAQDFSFFEAGHHIGYGGYINLKIGERAQFSPYLGLEHVFWPKSEGYSQVCNTDSFPTFMDVKDSLPGRDFRFFNIVFEPSFKIYSRRSGISFRFQPIFSYNIQRKVEQYTHTCGVLPDPQFVDYTPTALRGMSKFTISLGAGIVKEVRLRSGGGLALEPGVKLMLSRLLYVKEAANGLDFNLFPAGVYLNLSFFK